MLSKPGAVPELIKTDQCLYEHQVFFIIYVILIIESMKMEIPVEAPSAGTIREIRAAEGDSIEEGDVLAVLD